MNHGTDRQLVVVAYHYVRDLPRTRFPEIKGLLTDGFRAQVASLAEQYEMATLEMGLDFLAGRYTPKKDLCMMSFDDGLKDHYETVLPILVERGIEGLFFLITACQDEHRVVPVHKSHFLMAALGLDAYRAAFTEQLAERFPEIATDVDAERVRRTYQWDEPDVGAFKFLVNHTLDMTVRDAILDDLFPEHLGDEAAFASELYLDWREAAALQSSGMVLGAHSHSHVPLARLSDDKQMDDVVTCTDLLRRNLSAQAVWPFSYPHGKPDTFNERTVEVIRANGYDCAFAGTLGLNGSSQDRYMILRIDCNDVAA